jgi:hypothetical protein
MKWIENAVRVLLECDGLLEATNNDREENEGE